MKTVIIGSGNVASHLARAFREANLPVVQLYGRNEVALQELSDELSVPYSTDTLADADFYLIAVNDSAIEEISKKIKKTDCLVAHTSGSVSRDTLQGSYRKSVFYPLQTFSKNKKLDYSEIPVFIETETEEDLKKLQTLAGKISHYVSVADSEQRKYIHLTAVFACNFVNHLYARAKEIADARDIPFQYFFPLIQETTDKIGYLPPIEAQTGPAVRNDKKVLAAHEALLSDEHLEIYRTMNESIKKMYEL